MLINTRSVVFALLSVVMLQHIPAVLAVSSTKKKMEREKRALPLIFPPTAPTRAQWIVGIGIPLEDLLYEAMTTGYVFKAEYFLPSTVEQLRTKTSLPITVPVPSHSERKLQGNSKLENFWVSENELRANQSFANFMQNSKKVVTSYRWTVYKGLEGLANRLGLGGRTCILKSICEAAEVPFDYRNGLFGDILYILLTPSSSADVLSEYSDNDYFHAESLGRSGANCNEIFRSCSKSLLNHFSDVNTLTKDIVRALG